MLELYKSNTKSKLIRNRHKNFLGMEINSQIFYQKYFLKNKEVFLYFFIFRIIYKLYIL